MSIVGALIVLLVALGRELLPPAMALVLYCLGGVTVLASVWFPRRRPAAAPGQPEAPTAEATGGWREFLGRSKLQAVAISAALVLGLLWMLGQR